MNKHEALINLHTILAHSYPNESSARGVVQRAGLNHLNIDFSGSASSIWYSILQEAENTNKTDDLFQGALKDYGTNPTLAAAVETYRQAAKPPQPSPKPSQEQEGSSKDKSTLVAILQVVVPVVGTIVLVYFGYQQIIEPLRMSVAATQTAEARAEVTSAAQTAVAAVPVDTPTPENEPTSTMTPVPPTDMPPPHPNTRITGSLPGLEYEQRNRTSRWLKMVTY